jgi:hypothetical protein
MNGSASNQSITTNDASSPNVIFVRLSLFFRLKIRPGIHNTASTANGNAKPEGNKNNLYSNSKLFNRYINVLKTKMYEDKILNFSILIKFTS